MIKKFLLLCSTLCLICLFIVSKNVKASELTYTTSDGYTYALDEIQISLDDFENASFKSSQDVIDFIFYVSMSKECLTSDYGDNRYEVASKNLTADEIVLLTEYFYYAPIASKVSDEAVEETKEVYPNECSDNDKGNAFQHCYWTMLLAYKTDINFAYAFVQAHENYDGNPELSKNMDLYNDKVAYDWYVNYTDVITEDLVWRKSVEFKENGKLIYIIKNYKYICEEMYYMEQDKTEYLYNTGDFYAYTNSNVPYNLPSRVYTVVKKNPNGPSIIG